ncbi:MAG: 12-oxophytodienoate reductase, partial [Sphingomonadaceae bacterium]|nr:12-oxophytodienoate reductase [Sphingomonadaceae bacterium]
MTNPLFTPFTLAGLNLPNRIVMAPMTRSFSPGGVPGANVADYYRRRAEGQVGLIVTEGTGVDRPGALNDPNVPHFHGEAALGGWGKVVEAVHGAGGRIAPQLWHVGGMRNVQLPDYRHEAEGPSGLLRPGKEYGRAMSEEDIADAVAAFARSAADAVRLGFDAVELHGAHGYLIDQFLWEGTNVRDDRWNGDLPARARFAGEIVHAVRAAIGTTPLILRLSQWKQQDFTARLAPTPDAMAAWLQPLADAGVDAFHCSQRRFWEAEYPEIDGAEGLNFAGWTKKLTGKTTITVGSVGLSGEFVAAFGGEASKPA